MNASFIILLHAWNTNSDSRTLCSLTGQLMQVEERGKGSVPWSVYGIYIQAAGGVLVFLLILLLFVLNVGSTAFSNWWLSYWIKQGSGVRMEERERERERERE